jgi:hypothetical protein
MDCADRLKRRVGMDHNEPVGAVFSLEHTHEHPMHAELLYTSAPQGLKQGSRGFCTVLSTQGMPLNLAQRLEALSMYRHVFAPGDPRAANNPVCHAHLRFALGGKQVNLISRIADYGLDYSQRTNKLAHHIVVDSPLPPAGPAALLEYSGVMRQSWDGKCDTPPTGPELPSLTISPEPCHVWGRVTGDAGWGGVVANAWLKPGSKTVWLVFSESQSSSLLKLIAESIALLPPSARWQATFSTYFTNLPPDVECKVRCVLAGSEEARLAKARGEVIDLSGSLGEAPVSAEVDAARTGKIMGSDAFSSRAPGPTRSRSSEGNAEAPFQSASHTGNTEPWPQSKPASQSSKAGPPPAPVAQGGRTQLGFPETHAAYSTHGDPYSGTRKKSSGWPVALLLVAGLFLLIFLPLLGGGAVFLAMKFGPRTAASLPEESNADAANNDPALPAENTGGDTNGSDNIDKSANHEGASPDAPTTSQATATATPSITADNFDIAIQLKQPIPELGDNLLWLIDGTKITVEIVPKKKENAQHVQLQTDWLTEIKPVITLKLNNKDLPPDQSADEPGKYTTTVTEKVIESIFESQPNLEKPNIKATGSIGNDKQITTDLEVEIPQIQVSLKKTDILCLLEPKFFKSKSNEDRKRLYSIEKTMDWMNSLNATGRAEEWYIHGNTNIFNTSHRLLVFGNDETTDEQNLKRDFVGKFKADDKNDLEEIQYSEGLDETVSDFLKFISSKLSKEPFHDILATIKKSAGEQQGEKKQSAYEALELFNDLLVSQEKSYRQYKNNEAMPGSPNEIYKEPRDKALALKETLAVVGKDWETYYPTNNPSKIASISNFLELWISSTKDAEKLRGIWKKTYKHKQDIEKIISELLHKERILFYKVQSKENREIFFKIPVIVKYQPPAPTPPPKKNGSLKPTPPETQDSRIQGER